MATLEELHLDLQEVKLSVARIETHMERDHEERSELRAAIGDIQTLKERQQGFIKLGWVAITAAIAALAQSFIGK